MTQRIRYDGTAPGQGARITVCGYQFVRDSVTEVDDELAAKLADRPGFALMKPKAKKSSKGKKNG